MLNYLSRHPLNSCRCRKLLSVRKGLVALPASATPPGMLYRSSSPSRSAGVGSSDSAHFVGRGKVFACADTFFFCHATLHVWMLRFPRMAGASQWLEDEWEGIPDPPAPRDPNWAIRRIATAILLRALLDARFRDRYVRNDARRFLEARDPSSREMLHLLVQSSGINRVWFRRRLVEFLDGASGAADQSSGQKSACARIPCAAGRAKERLTSSVWGVDNIARPASGCTPRDAKTAKQPPSGPRLVMFPVKGYERA